MAENKSNNEVKEEIIELLKSTGRDGVDDTISFLEESGFFEAPASSTKHLCVEGGLARHSLNTCRAALLLWMGRSSQAEFCQIVGSHSYTEGRPTAQSDPACVPAGPEPAAADTAPEEMTEKEIVV